MSLVRCDQEYSRYYHLKYNEVNKFQHKRVLVLTARKLARLVFWLLKDNRLYISLEQFCHPCNSSLREVLPIRDLISVP